MYSFVCVLVLAASVRATAADDWPEFRGPGGQGISTAVDVPIRWNATEGVKWKQPIAGTGWSSPVLAGGRIYLTTAVAGDNPDEISLRALCLDAADGRVLWNEEVIRPTSAHAREIHQKNSLASPTPVLAGDRLYVHFGHMGTAALDLDGDVLWRQTSLNYPSMHGNGGSPILVGARIVFSCDGSRDPFVVALERATGNVAWRVSRSGGARQSFSFTTPLAIEVDGTKQIISPASGYVGAYDPADGREIWRVHYGEGFSVIPRPVFAGGRLYVLSGYTTAQVVAIDPRGAAGDVTDSHVRWKYNRNVSLTPSPLLVGDELYVVSDNGIATCLNARTGDVNWTSRLGGDFSASPVLAGGHVYFQSEAGVTSVVKAGTKYELVSKNDLGERSLASPAVVDGAIFLRTESHLWRIGD
jgi:outer membrane protein assembly factor BamB